jgi:hypothetical protein
MTHVKSLLAALAALVVFAALFITVGVRLLLRRPPELPDDVGYVSNSPWVPSWLIVAVPLLLFAGVYWWTYIKLSRRRGRS